MRAIYLMLSSRFYRTHYLSHLSFADFTPSPFPKQALVFMCLQYKSLENTVEKGEIARNEQFLLFPQHFLLFRRTISHINQI